MMPSSDRRPAAKNELLHDSSPRGEMVTTSCEREPLTPKDTCSVGQHSAGSTAMIDDLARVLNVPDNAQTSPYKTDHR